MLSMQTRLKYRHWLIYDWIGITILLSTLPVGALGALKISRFSKYGIDDFVNHGFERYMF